MIREINAQDKQVFLEMAEEFYHSPAVAHPIPLSHAEHTFHEVLAGSPYATIFLLEKDGKPAGYAQVSLTHSTESDGLVAWLEELYIRPAFQGNGLGGSFFSYLEERFGDRLTRIRLEVEPDNEGALRLYRRLGFSEFPYLPMAKELNREN